MYFKFENLGQAFREINKGLMENEIPNQIVNSHAVAPIMHIQTDSSKVDFTLENLGYTRTKMKRLESTYMDYDRWEEFIEKLPKVKKYDELSYNFKEKKGFQHGGNPKKNCLLVISYQRIYNNFTIVWRATELGNKWGADLILLDKLFSSLPGELKDAGINLIMMHSYQELYTYPAVCEILGIKYNPKKFSKRYKHKYNRGVNLYYPKDLTLDTLYTKWGPIMRMQKALIRYREGE